MIQVGQIHPERINTAQPTVATPYQSIAKKLDLETANHRLPPRKSSINRVEMLMTSKANTELSSAGQSTKATAAEKLI